MASRDRGERDLIARTPRGIGKSPAVPFAVHVACYTFYDPIVARGLSVYLVYKPQWVHPSSHVTRAQIIVLT